MPIAIPPKQKTGTLQTESRHYDYTIHEAVLPLQLGGRIKFKHSTNFPSKVEVYVTEKIGAIALCALQTTQEVDALIEGLVYIRERMEHTADGH